MPAHFRKKKPPLSIADNRTPDRNRKGNNEGMIVFRQSDTPFAAPSSAVLLSTIKKNIPTAAANAESLLRVSNLLHLKRIYAIARPDIHMLSQEVRS